MAKITLEEQPEFLTFPKDSLLDLKVEECNVVTVQGQRGDWQKVEFKFKILNVIAIGDGSPVTQYQDMVGQTIWGSVPFRLTDNPENKLRLWAEALFGMPLGLGFELDTDNFISRKVKGVTGTYTKKAGNGQGEFVRHQIDALLPASGMQQQQATPQAVAASAPPQDPWASTSWGQPAQNQTDEPPF